MSKLSMATQEQRMKLWIARIRECRNSGKRVGQWCAENEIGVKTYYYWMRKIKQEAFDSLPAERKSKCVSSMSISPIASFTEIKLPETQVKPYSETALILRIGSTALEIQNGATDTVIENTLRALQKLC